MMLAEKSCKEWPPPWVLFGKRTGDYIVLFIHDIGNKFGYTYNKDHMRYFQRVLPGSRILAMFSGHWHSWGGQINGHRIMYDMRFEEDASPGAPETGCATWHLFLVQNSAAELLGRADASRPRLCAGPREILGDSMEPGEVLLALWHRRRQEQWQRAGQLVRAS
eukprot:g14731.t1